MSKWLRKMMATVTDPDFLVLLTAIMGYIVVVFVGQAMKEFILGLIVGIAVSTLGVERSIEIADEWVTKAKEFIVQMDGKEVNDILTKEGNNHDSETF